MPIAFLSFALAVATMPIAANESWKAPSLASVDEVRLAGVWAVAQRQCADRMAAAPLDNSDFILADLSLRRFPNRRYTEYSGDISGRWIGAGAFLAPLYPKPFAAFPTILAKVPEYQKPDGHFGADQKLPEIVHERDIAILWGNGRILIGLIEVFDRTGDKKSLESAKKLGDYLIATDSVFNKPERFVRKPGGYWLNWETYYFQCIEGLVGLHRVTHDARYLDEAKRIAATAVSIQDFDTTHSHGRLCAMRGLADLYAATGDARWREAVERDWATFMRKYRLPTGGVKEVLEPGCNRDEGCAECDWLRLNLSLWHGTGGGRYLDEAERSLKNHFIFQQFPNGGAGHRLFHQIAGQPVAFSGPIEEAWWCCSEHWARATADIARYAITGNEQGVDINLMIDCEGTIAGPGGKWKVTLRETADGLRATVTSPKPVTARVRVHRPSWALDGVKIEKPATLVLQETSDAWTFEGNWDGSQEFTLHLPNNVRAEPAPGNAGVLLRGNDLLAAHRSTPNAWLFATPPNVRPTVLWSAAMPSKDGRVTVPASLQPNADPNKPEMWKRLELSPLRAVVGQPHEWAWFSFQLREVPAETVTAIVSP